MLFLLVKGYARLVIHIFCRSIIINKPEILQARGPVLFAANHPNSFLDGMILTILLKQDLYSLARGDAFKNKRHEKILRWMHLLPVYRTSEGVENLSHNYTTFRECHDVFENKKHVIIFSEGRCINEWHLRPLRKGTARLAISAWQAGINLTVIPLGFNYNTFRNFGKNVFINFGEPITKEILLPEQTDAKALLSFNEVLNSQLEKLVYEIDRQDRKTLKEKIYVQPGPLKMAVLGIPALIGFIIHAPLYYLAKAFTTRQFDNDHFDSVMVAILMIAYPFYLLLITILVFFISGGKWALVSFVLLPFCAWACVQLKPQLDN